MNTKTLSVLAICAAVVATAVAAIVVSNNRSNEAKAYAEAEAAASDRVAAEAKIAAKNAEAEAEKRRTAEANAKAKADDLAAKKLAKETADVEAAAAKDRKTAAEAEAKVERAKSDAARSARDEAKTKAESVKMEQQNAKDLLAAESAKAEAEAAKLATEKLKADKIIAEAKLLELRKTDFETLERDLLEWKLDLEARERALQPEKTIASLSWAGGMEDSIIDDKGNISKQTKVPYNPETDTSLPVASRKLAKTVRQTRERESSDAAKVRDSIVASMEALYIQALKDDRVIDANFYRNSLKSMYPDWEFKGEQSK